MKRQVALAFAACCLLSACGKSGAPAEAEKTRAALTGDDKQAAADNPACKAFKVSEIEAYIGEPVNAGGAAALGTGCQWTAKDGTGDVIVSVVPSRYHEKPSAQKGYRKLAEPGTEGFVAPYFDGWLSGAITGANAVRVSTAGAKASEANTIALMTEAAKRLGS